MSIHLLTAIQALKDECEALKKDNNRLKMRVNSSHEKAERYKLNLKSAQADNKDLQRMLNEVPEDKLTGEMIIAKELYEINSKID